MPPAELPVSPEELEFFAEEEPIEIVPNCSVPGGYMDGILARYGPFEPQRKVQVPMWLALHLHKRNKARILLPDWLDVQVLSAAIEKERSSTGMFTQQPYHYVEQAMLLLQHAHSAFDSDAQRAQVRSLLDKLTTVRRNKMGDGLRSVDSCSTVLVTGLGSYDLNLIRLNFQGALNMFLQLETAEREVQASQVGGASALS